MTEDKSKRFIWWRPILGFVVSFAPLVALFFVFTQTGYLRPATEPVTPKMEKEIRQELSKSWRLETLSEKPSIWNWDDGGTITKLETTPGDSGFRITDMTGAREVYQVDWQGASYAVRASRALQMKWALQEIRGDPHDR